MAIDYFPLNIGFKFRFGLQMENTWMKLTYGQKVAYVIKCRKKNLEITSFSNRNGLENHNFFLSKENKCQLPLFINT